MPDDAITLRLNDLASGKLEHLEKKFKTLGSDTSKVRDFGKAIDSIKGDNLVRLGRNMKGLITDFNQGLELANKFGRLASSIKDTVNAPKEAAFNKEKLARLASLNEAGRKNHMTAELTASGMSAAEASASIEKFLSARAIGRNGGRTLRLEEADPQEIAKFERAAAAIGRLKLKGPEKAAVLDQVNSAEEKFGDVRGYDQAEAALLKNKDLAKSKDFGKLALGLALYTNRNSEKDSAEMLDRISEGTQTTQDMQALKVKEPRDEVMIPTSTSSGTVLEPGRTTYKIIPGETQDDVEVFKTFRRNRKQNERLTKEAEGKNFEGPPLKLNEEIKGAFQVLAENLPQVVSGAISIGLVTAFAKWTFGSSSTKIAAAAPEPVVKNAGKAGAAAEKAAETVAKAESKPLSLRPPEPATPAGQNLITTPTAAEAKAPGPASKFLVLRPTTTATQPIADLNLKTLSENYKIKERNIKINSMLRPRTSDAQSIAENSLRLAKKNLTLSGLGKGIGLAAEVMTSIPGSIAFNPTPAGMSDSEEARALNPFDRYAERPVEDWNIRQQMAETGIRDMPNRSTNTFSDETKSLNAQIDLIKSFDRQYKIMEEQTRILRQMLDGQVRRPAHAIGEP